MMPGCSRNWRRTSWTTVPAERPTARMARAENRNGTEPPISRPMNVFGSDEAGRGQQAHAAEGDEGKGELDVALAERGRHAEGDRDGDDRPHRGLEAHAEARQDGRGRSGAGRLGDLLHRGGLGGREVL